MIEIAGSLAQVSGLHEIGLAFCSSISSVPEFALLRDIAILFKASTAGILTGNQDVSIL